MEIKDYHEVFESSPKSVMCMESLNQKQDYNEEHANKVKCGGCAYY